MATRPTRSLRHEYELHVQEEIENYKDSIPRSALLSLGDEAVRSLGSGAQTTLTELLLCDEVDRIIFKRLRLPSYTTWRRRRVKIMEEVRRPEYWGLAPHSVIVRAVPQSGESGGRVLVAGATEGRSALYLAANGCDVTAIDSRKETLERVMDAAVRAGLGQRVHAEIGDLGSWKPETPLAAVLCAAAALIGLDPAGRARAIEVLQAATAEGGVHVLASSDGTGRVIPIEELRSRYRGWEVSVERSEELGEVFMARKAAS
jgi:SAM-dependent methyltransferase